MTRPSSGVKPMVVSTDLPWRTAASDAPAPRWHVTMRNCSTGRPNELGRPAAGVGVAEAVESDSGGLPYRSRHSAGTA